MGLVRRGVSVGLVLLLVPVLTFSVQLRSEALVPAITAPAFVPAGLTAAGASTGVVGASSWTAGAGATAAVGAAPVVAAIVGAALVGGLVYVGYRHFSGDPVEWWWQEGASDPAITELSEVYVTGTDHQVAFVEFIATATNVRVGLKSNRADKIIIYNKVQHVDGSWGSKSYDYRDPGESWLFYSNVGTSDPADIAQVVLWTKTQSDGRTDSEIIADGDAQQIWFDGVEGEPQFGDDPFAQARVRVDYECTEIATGTVAQRVAYSAYYGADDPPAAMPQVSCLEGERLTGAQAFREAPGVDDLPLIDPFTLPEIAPMPEFVPSELEPDWDACHNLTVDSPCELVITELDPELQPEEQRRLNPTTDFGWWFKPDRDQLYQCHYLMDGASVLLPLEQCASYVWEEDVNGVLQQQRITTPNPELPATTATGLPPAAPAPDRDCMGAKTDGDGFSSWLVFAGVACALEWAFVPSQTQTQFANLRTEAQTRPPFVATTTAIPFLTGAVGAWGGSDCPSVIANFTPDGFGLQGVGAEIPCDPQIPGLVAVRAMQMFAIVAAGGFAMWRIYSSTVEA